MTINSFPIETVTIDISAIPSRANFAVRNAENAAEGAALGDGVYWWMEGLQYVNKTGGTACDDLGVSDVSRFYAESVPALSEVKADTQDGSLWVVAAREYEGVYVATTSGTVDILSMTSQSKGLGASGFEVPNTEEFLTFMPSGLTKNSGSSELIVSGPNGDPIDDTSTTGLVPATNENSGGGQQRWGVNYLFGMEKANWDRANRNPAVPVVTMASGTVGTKLENLDADALTGTGDLTAWENHVKIVAESVSAVQMAGLSVSTGWHLIMQGDADNSTATGDWLDILYGEDNSSGLLGAVVDDRAVHGLPAPKFLITQESGRADTTGMSFNVKRAQTNSTLMQNATFDIIFGGAMYPYIQSDGVHPNLDSAKRIASTMAYFASKEEVGDPTLYPEPFIVATSSNSISIEYELTDGTPLEMAFLDGMYNIDTSIPFGTADYGEGDDVTFFGLGVTGSSSGSKHIKVTPENSNTRFKIEVFDDAAGTTPTAISGRQIWYAFQTQSVTAGDNYPAHRGNLYFPELDFVSKLTGDTVHVFAPSFKTDTQ